jgi:hypothetical protein
MTWKDRLLKPFRGWMPVEAPETRNLRRGFLVLTNKKTIFALSSILLTSIVVWQMTLIPPLPPPITPIKPTFLATCEWNGRLRIWSYNQSLGDFQVVHTVERAYYESIALGDIDTDGVSELLCTKTFRTPDDLSFRVALDVYKVLETGCWERITTIHLLEPIEEDRMYSDHEIVVSEVDGKPGNEVVIKTHDWLTVYQYSEESGTLVNLSSKKAVVDEMTVIFESVVVGDIDEDGLAEIIVSANDPTKIQQGYLMIFQDASLQTFEITSIDAHLGPTSPQGVDLGKRYRHHTVHVGDVDGDGDLEICSSGYRCTTGEDEWTVEEFWFDENYYRDTIHLYLFIWDHNGELLCENYISKNYYWHPASAQYTGFQTLVFDIGDINLDHIGDEIAYWFTSEYEYPHVILSSLEGTELKEIWRTTTDGGRNLYIADADGDGDREIVLGGKYLTYYLEIFDAEGRSVWKRYVSEQGESDVMNIAIG